MGRKYGTRPRRWAPRGRRSAAPSFHPLPCERPFWDTGASATIRTPGRWILGGIRAMPLLPLEPFVYPDDLLDQPVLLPEASARWWVLHTRPRAEKSLARRLLRTATPFFLPLRKRQWRHRGRLLCSYVPLFPGYVFLRSDSQS